MRKEVTGLMKPRRVLASLLAAAFLTLPASVASADDPPPPPPPPPGDGGGGNDFGGGGNDFGVGGNDFGGGPGDGDPPGGDFGGGAPGDDDGYRVPGGDNDYRPPPADGEDGWQPPSGDGDHGGPGDDDGYRVPGGEGDQGGPMSDDEMFGGFFGPGPGPGGQGDWDDDGWVPPTGDDDSWLPPVGDGEDFDRDEMFKAFGFDDDAPQFGPGDDDDHRGFMPIEGQGPDGDEGGLNQFFMRGPPTGDEGDWDDDGQGPMPGGAKGFFFSAMPGMDDEYEGPLSDDEMFGGFFGPGPGPGGQGDWDDDGWVPPTGDDDSWLPPVGDGEDFDRDEMFKAFGFDDDAPQFGPGDDDDHRGFMQWDDEGGFEGPDGDEGGLNQFFMAGPDGVPDDDGQGPMPGGAKDFFFKTDPVSDSIEEADDSGSALGNSQQIQAPAQKQDFFNPGETDAPAEEEVPKTGFFKPEAEPKKESEPSAAAFFANSATSSSSTNSAPRPSFFNPGGVSNLFTGGSSNNEVREDSELTRDDDREFEPNNDSDGQGQSRDDRNDEDRAEAP